MSIATSLTHPLFVDFLPGLKLGMTLCPGKQQPASYTGVHWQRDLDSDLHALATDFECQVLVTLLSPDDFDRLGVPNLLQRVKDFGIESIYYDIQDTTTPTRAREWTEAVMLAVARLGECKTVVVHCMGGLGRTGCFLLCVLKAMGTPFEVALELVRSARKGAGGNREQREYASQWHPS
eukprot:NODE_5321_length_670_cov_17.038674_g5158_i0.p1 GENE.NODE_5321_length_670_cov_17.038674_g5158_i0~~NODE_5321_length_670_cov_17.038674_g5158_i0.p1  ORF type:complete len:200 (-),score=66.97 NODE_5321_length_670_cov_17.038674_g5158_i0:71-607(-)